MNNHCVTNMQIYIEQDSKFVLLSWHSYLEWLLIGFGLKTGFTDHFTKRIVTTLNYNSLIGLHILKITVLQHT
jgi:hypothetical protein